MKSNRLVYLCFLIFHLPLSGMLDKRQNVEMQSLVKRKKEGPKECSICFEALFAQNANNQHDVVTLACSREHSYHFDCLNRWRHAKSENSCTCPLCRANLISDNDGRRVFDAPGTHREIFTFSLSRLLLLKCWCIGLGEED